MKKLFILVFAIALCLGVLCLGASASGSEPPLVDGAYQLDSDDDLFWFAEQVNGGETGINAVLTADITINKNVLDAVANNNTTNLTQWMPIGTVQKQYTGAFDGQGHTISGLYYSGSGNNDAGLLGRIDGGQVKNVKVADSYMSSFTKAGGVCGYMNSGSISNCRYEGKIVANSSNAAAGGVCAVNNTGTITNCFSTGSFAGGSVGGVCGMNDIRGTITNCFSTGTVVAGTGTYNAGGVCGYNNGGRITNCYWLDKAYSGNGIGAGSGTVANVESKSAEQFASGEVAWLLNSSTNGPWRQNLGEGGDAFPVLDSTHGEVVKLTVDGTASYYNSGYMFEGTPADGKVYVDGDGNIVYPPYTVEADTTLTSKYPVTAAIDTTSTLSKVYDGTTAAPEGLSITLKGVVSGDDVTATAECSFEEINVGSGKTITASNITLTGEKAGEYVLSNTTAETDAGEITPKTVTITAEDKSAYMGDKLPELSYKADGFIGNDKLTEEPILSCNANMTKAGTYEITVSGGAASDNYKLVYKNGTLTVKQSWIITVKPGNGAADEISYISPGGSFTIPDAPKNGGYIFLGWRCGDATYKAGETIEVTSDMTFTAVWGNLPDVDPEEPEPEPELPFYDVAKGDWFYDAVKYVYYADLMDGVEEHIFAPNDTLTRAMVWTIIARAEGVDTDGGATWYAKAQEWVVAKGISDGENPSAAITRQELVTMLWRLAGEPVVNYALTAPDADAISGWAYEAMRWVVSEGIIEGDENGLIHPTATCTRAEAAAILMRLG